LKLELWLRSNPVSKTFLLRKQAIHQGSQTQNEGRARTYKKQGRIMTILGLQYDAGTTKKVPEPYKKQLLHIFSASCIVNYKEFISLPLYVGSK